MILSPVFFPHGGSNANYPQQRRPHKWSVFVLRSHLYHRYLSDGIQGHAEEVGMSAEPLCAPRNKSRFTFTQAPTQREEETARTKDWTEHCTAFHAAFIVALNSARSATTPSDCSRSRWKKKRKKTERFGEKRRICFKFGDVQQKINSVVQYLYQQSRN